jgi:hypothetical protein
VRVHSWNPDGALRMCELFNDAGYNVELRPFDLNEIAK